MHAFGKVAVTQAKFDVLAGNDEANPKVGLGRLQESCISLGYGTSFHLLKVKMAPGGVICAR